MEHIESNLEGLEGIENLTEGLKGIEDLTAQEKVDRLAELAIASLEGNAIFAKAREMARRYREQGMELTPAALEKLADDLLRQKER